MPHVSTCLKLSPPYSPIYPLLSKSLFLGRDGRDSREDELRHKGLRRLNLASLPRLIHASPEPSLASVVAGLIAIFVPSTDLLRGLRSREHRQLSPLKRRPTSLDAWEIQSTTATAVVRVTSHLFHKKRPERLARSSVVWAMSKTSTSGVRTGKSKSGSGAVPAMTSDMTST